MWATHKKNNHRNIEIFPIILFKKYYGEKIQWINSKFNNAIQYHIEYL